MHLFGEYERKGEIESPSLVELQILNEFILATLLMKIYSVHVIFTAILWWLNFINQVYHPHPSTMWGTLSLAWPYSYSIIATERCMEFMRLQVLARWILTPMHGLMMVKRELGFQHRYLFALCSSDQYHRLPAFSYTCYNVYFFSRFVSAFALNANQLQRISLRKLLVTIITNVSTSGLSWTMHRPKV